MVRHNSLGRWLKRQAADFGKNQQGNIPILTGLAMLAITGFAGMGIDSAGWYAEKRLTQNMADSAAIAATHAYLGEPGAYGHQQTMEGEALDAALDNGYETGDGHSIIVTELLNPGSNGLTPVVEVLISQTAPSHFAGLFFGETKRQISARAVGGVLVTGPACILALSEDEANAVYFTGSSTTFVACGVTSNSNDYKSFVVSGNATIEAAMALAVGGIVVRGSGELNADEEIVTPNHPSMEDPFISRAFPVAPESCDLENGYELQSETVGGLAPSMAGGAFKICGGVSVHGALNLAPGTYYISNGDLTINAQATVTCTGCTGEQGVTLVMTGDDGASVGDIRINGGATVDLTAPADPDNPYQGIVLYKDRIADEDGVNRLNGDANMLLNGAVYIPTQHLEYSGGADITACNMLVSRKITFTGDFDTYVKADEAACAPLGLGENSEAVQRLVILVE